MAQASPEEFLCRVCFSCNAHRTGHNWGMASPEIGKLWKLHTVDLAIVEIRQRAAALDAGSRIAAEIKALEAENESGSGGKYKELSRELTDLDLVQKGIEEKLKKIDAQLYGGKVVNPREVVAYEQEIAMLKRQRATHDERILELWEEIPPLEETAKRIEKGIEERKRALAEHRKRALEERSRLEAQFKEAQAKRAPLAQQVEKSLLAKYETIRKKHGDIGMAEVKNRRCSACGTDLPERTLEMAKEGKVVTCEACHRILYYPEGLL
jgi:uncharacterized protein